MTRATAPAAPLILAGADLAGIRHDLISAAGPAPDWDRAERIVAGN
jgi:hypothetical protein